MNSDVLQTFSDVIRYFQMISGSEINISVLKLLSFETSAIALRVSILEKLVSEKRFGIGFGKFGLEKKSWLRFRKKVTVSENLVSKKVSVLVSVHLV